MGMTDDEIHQRGFKVLARAEDHVADYARGLGATRREWANANEDLVVRFIRAMIRATDWVMDGKNKEEVVRVLLAENKNNQARAEEQYTESISSRFVLIFRPSISITTSPFCTPA